MNPPTALFRADGDSRIGAGHLTRCAALADALASLGWRCVFASARDGLEMVRRIVAETADVIALDGPPDRHVGIALAGCGGQADAAIVDQYELGDAFATSVRTSARLLVRFDDMGAASLAGDIVVNPAPEATAGVYAPAHALVGPAYALLRPAFAARRGPPRRLAPGRKRVLVTLGASTPTAQVVALASELAGVAGVAVRAIGAADWSAPAPSGVDLVQDWTDLADEIAGADLVVSAAGGTIWERCCLGVPGLAVITADNQRANAASIAGAGAGIVLGALSELEPGRLAREARDLLEDPARYAAMADSARSLCDGQGARRVARAIAPPPDRAGVPVYLRPAVRTDCKTLFSWQCDPDVRRHFRNPAAPAWEEHVAWFERRLARTDCVFQIIESGRRPAGVLRADRGTDGWEISILVAPELVGRGIGRIALGLLDELMPRERLLAEVAPANEASRRMFHAAGYRQVGPDRYAREVSA